MEWMTIDDRRQPNERRLTMTTQQTRSDLEGDAIAILCRIRDLERRLYRLALSGSPTTTEIVTKGLLIRAERFKLTVECIADDIAADEKAA